MWEETVGLYDYKARFYDPYLNRFLSPDPIIPDPYNPLDWDRYSYTRNNPVNYTDPTGHMVACDRDDWACQTHWDDPVVEEEPYIPNPLDPVFELVATILWEPLDWATMADSCMQGDCSPWFILGMAPIIPGSVGKYIDDAIQFVPASAIHWSQKGVSAATKSAPVQYLDDLAQDIAQGWNGDPLRVLEIDGKLVSLDNRRLTVAKMLDIDVPVTVSHGYTLKDLVREFSRDGIFTEIPIRGTSPGQMIIDMFGRLIER